MISGWCSLEHECFPRAVKVDYNLACDFHKNHKRDFIRFSLEKKYVCVFAQVKTSGTWSWAETGTTASRSRSRTLWSSRPSSRASAGPAGSFWWGSASGSTGGERRERVWATTQVRTKTYKKVVCVSSPCYCPPCDFSWLFWMRS